MYAGRRVVASPDSELRGTTREKTYRRTILIPKPTFHLSQRSVMAVTDIHSAIRDNRQDQ